MSKLLEQIFQQDQSDRKDIKSVEDFAGISLRDKARAKQVRALLREHKVKTGRECYIAAFILHHQLSIRASQMAVSLAKKSVQKDYQKSKWLFAAATDRLLRKQGKSQKYGTQYSQKKGGSLQVDPIDPNTTDTERALYNVPTLDEIYKKCDEYNSRIL